MPYYLAIIVQAILFGAFHMNAIQGCYAFVLGLGMGYVMHLYNNIFVTIIIHMIFNLIGTYGSDFLPYGGDTIIGFFLWMLGSLVVTYVSIILLRKGASSVKEKEFTADI
jgi:membrane protease YdiL (CAAX protease family)